MTCKRTLSLRIYALALGDILARLLRDPAARVGPLACALAARLGFPVARLIEQATAPGACQTWT